jgi:CDP-glycerol glycerophosphotransferase (TagB/SpsB family)
MPFQLRGLRPIAQCFADWSVVQSLAELEQFAPDLVLANDAGMFRALREYCDRHHAWLVGLRHGAANKYIGPDPEFALTDYVCGSEWDREDFRQHNLSPLKRFLLTGNPWVDDIFRIPARPLNRRSPTILFAPTYNVETSAAAFFGDALVSSIRAVYPDSRVIIKPHPLMLDDAPPALRPQNAGPVFERIMDGYRRIAARDVGVVLVDDGSRLASEFYAEADILISDGSSLIFEFMTLERPILLYSSGRRVANWATAWDLRAPGNAMRGVGVEFSTVEEFQERLSGAFTTHEGVTRARQRECTRLMHADFRDGRSAQRAAHALAAEPGLAVLVLDSHSAGADEPLACPVIARLRNCHVFTATQPFASTMSASTRAAVLARTADGNTNALVVHGGKADTIPDAGTVSHMLRRLDSGDMDAIGGLHEALGACAEYARVPAWWLARSGTVASLESLARLDAADASDTLVRLAETHPERPLADHLTTDSGDLDDALRAIVPSFLARLRAAGIRRVALYGTGSHTRRLLPIWRVQSGPTVNALIVTTAGSEQSFMDLPVIAADLFDPTSVDAVVPSSQAFERELWLTCEERWPDLPVFRVWAGATRA